MPMSVRSTWLDASTIRLDGRIFSTTTTPEEVPRMVAASIVHACVTEAEAEEVISCYNDRLYAQR